MNGNSWCTKMKKPFLMNFRALYIVNTFIEIIYKRVRTGEWQTPEITPDELYNLMNSNETPNLLYVLRMVGEDGLIPDIKRLHTRKLIGYLDRLEPYKDEPFVIVCGGGGMSLVAAEIMIKAGFKDVKSLNGGMQLWNKKGYPTTKSSN